MRSDSQKITKNTIVKATPHSVATFLVTRFTSAVARSTRKMRARPTGSSHLPTQTFKGTRHARGRRSLKRSTTIDSALKTKLHTTPKAYASPSAYTLPRLARMVKICSPTTMSMIRWVVPHGDRRLERRAEPVRQDAVLGHAVQHAVRADDRR